MGWSEYSSNGWALVTHELPQGLDAHSGVWLAWLGGDDFESSILEQEVTISAARPYLIYWLVIGSDDACGDNVGGVLFDGNAVDAYGVCSDYNTGGWIQRSIDMRAYVGQTAVLTVAAFTKELGASSMFVDDFSFAAEAATVGGAAPWPVAQGPDLVTAWAKSR